MNIYDNSRNLTEFIAQHARQAHHATGVMILFALSFLAIARPSSGRVFWKQRADASARIAQLATGGNSIFQSNVRINDGHGKLDVIGCNTHLSSVMRQLRNCYASTTKLTDFHENKSMGFGIIQSKGIVCRILVLGLGPPEQTIVFNVSQSLSEYEKSLHSKKKSHLDKIPEYPGSIVKSFMSIEQTKSDVQVSTAHGSLSRIYFFFQSSFLQNGWKQILSKNESNTGYSGITVYKKGFEICCLLIQALDRGQENMITLLHKRLSVE